MTTRNHLPHLMHLHLLSSKGSGAHFVRVTIIGQRVKKSRTFSQLFFLVFSDQTSAQKKSRRCGRNHHKSNGETSLTHVGSETPVTMPSVEPNPTSGSTASVTTSTSRSHVKVLLQTARTQSYSEQHVPVRSLLDSGSQRSYFTNALKKKKIKLKFIKSENLNLYTFGNEKFPKRELNLMELCLQEKSAERTYR